MKIPKYMKHKSAYLANHTALSDRCKGFDHSAFTDKFRRNLCTTLDNAIALEHHEFAAQASIVVLVSRVAFDIDADDSTLPDHGSFTDLYGSSIGDDFRIRV